MACTVSMKSHLTIWYLIDLLNFSFTVTDGQFHCTESGITNA